VAKKPKFEHATATFNVVPHGIEATIEVQVKGKEPIKMSGCRDFGGDDGPEFTQLLATVAQYATQMDLTRARLGLLALVKGNLLEEGDKKELAEWLKNPSRTPK
jgi:hypothetical protein